MNEQRVHALGIARGLLEIDAQGRVWRVARLHNHGTGAIVPVKRRRAETPGRGGYLAASAYDGRKVIRVQASRLVWYHLHGAIPEGIQINHRNGDKHDNRPENLELATPSENSAHSYRVLGRARFGPCFGEGNHNAKLTADSVREIRARLAAGEAQGTIAADYGIGRTAIGNIWRGRTWRNLL
jgi:hypothetical protein